MATGYSHRRWAEQARELACGEATSRALGYCLWLVVWATLSFLLFLTGLMLIQWGSYDVDSGAGAIALGIPLAAWGLVLTVYSGVAVWVTARDSLTRHGV